MSEGLIVVVVALAAAAVLALVRAASDGRVRGTRRVRGSEQAGGEVPVTVLDGSGLEPQLGGRATLLQFSSAFCAPCRATRRVLGDVAAVVPGVAHVEVDAEDHLDLVRRVGVLRTPTTLVLDASGCEVSRAGGVPRKEQVLAALAAAVSDEVPDEVSDEVTGPDLR